MPFVFIAGHYWVALAGLRRAAGPRRREAADHPGRAWPGRPTGAGPRRRPGADLTRRGFLTAVAAAVGRRHPRDGRADGPSAAEPCRCSRPRRPDSARRATGEHAPRRPPGVRAIGIADPAYRLVVDGPGGASALSLADLAALPQTHRRPADHLRRGLERTRAPGPGYGVRRPGRARRRSRRRRPWSWTRCSRQSVLHVRARPGSRGRSADADRAATRRRGTAPRPRLPGPADRAEPARRAADQMGQPPHVRDPMTVTRLVIAVVGTRSSMGYAVLGAITDGGVDVVGVSAVPGGCAGRDTTCRAAGCHRRRIPPRPVRAAVAAALGPGRPVRERGGYRPLDPTAGRRWPHRRQPEPVAAQLRPRVD